jgi:hypothetical protein
LNLYDNKEIISSSSRGHILDDNCNVRPSAIINQISYSKEGNSIVLYDVFTKETKCQKIMQINWEENGELFVSPNGNYLINFNYELKTFHIIEKEGASSMIYNEKKGEAHLTAID